MAGQLFAERCRSGLGVDNPRSGHYEAPHNQVHFRTRLLQCDARLEPTNYMEPVIPQLALIVHIDCERHQDVSLFQGKEATRSGRHNSDDRPALAAQRQRLTDHGRIAAEAGLQESMTEKRHTRGFRAILLRREGPPQLRRQTQRWKHIGRDTKNLQSIRRALSSQTEKAFAKSYQMFESLRLRSPGKVTVTLSASVVTTVLSFRHPDQPLRLVERHGIEHPRIHDAENRRIRADAERQRENGDQRHDGMPAQHPRRVAQILPQRFKLMSRANFPDFLFDLFPAPEFYQGRAARFRRIETLADILLDEHLQISVNLFRQLMFRSGPAEQVAPETG